MNRPPDDEYGSLQDLLGEPYDDPGDSGSEDPDAPAADSAGGPGDDSVGDPAASDAWRGLPAGMQAEYAEAFRRGYERARRGEGSIEEREAEEPTQPIWAAEPEPAEPEPAEPTRRIDRSDLAGVAWPERTPPFVPPAPTGPSSSERPEAPTRTASARALLAKLLGSDEDRDPRLLGVGLVVLALVVIVAAFGLGRLFAQDANSEVGSADTRAAGKAGGHDQPVYHGAVRAVQVAAAKATCQTGGSVDAAGNPVTYEPAKAFDANLTTAWRCDGSGKGQRFTVTLPRGTVVAQVGLVPGYAKTDPASGVDRYAENNRITKVRWRFDDGSTFVQRMSGNPVDRSMRLMRVPETPTRRVVLQILASRPGSRNTVAISELRVASPRG